MIDISSRTTPEPPIPWADAQFFEQDGAGALDPVRG
jgi:hypothetical protein